MSRRLRPPPRGRRMPFRSSRIQIPTVARQHFSRRTRRLKQASPVWSGTASDREGDLGKSKSKRRGQALPPKSGRTGRRSPPIAPAQLEYRLLRFNTRLRRIFPTLRWWSLTGGISEARMRRNSRRRAGRRENEQDNRVLAKGELRPIDRRSGNNTAIHQLQFIVAAAIAIIAVRFVDKVLFNFH